MMKKVATQKNNKIRLAIQKAELQVAWNESKKQSHTLAKYNAYLNHVCLSTFTNWLQNWIKDTLEENHKIHSYPNNLSSVWEFMNGVALQFGETRLVLVPSNDIDLEEFRVEREWIDISTWRADYYIDIRVNLDAEDKLCWIEVLGFATYQQLKVDGIYNRGNRTYSLPSEKLISDLDVMTIALNFNVKSEVSDLPVLPKTEVKRSIEDLGKPSLYSPRLQTDISFEKWAVLLENEEYRQELFDWRMGKVVSTPEMTHQTVTTLSNSDTESNRKYIILTQWLQQLRQDRQEITDKRWQLSERLLDFSKKLEPMYSRSGSTTVQTEKAIAAAIRRLTEEKDSRRQLQVLKDLGAIGKGNLQAAEALQKFIQTPDIDLDTRLMARLILGKIDPTNSLAATERSRLVDLGMQLGNYKVNLIISIMQKDENKINILVRVQSSYDFKKLPSGLNLSILDKFGKTVPDLEVTARSDGNDRGIDDFLKLRFNLAIGKFFKVRLSLKNWNITEDILV